MKTKTIGLLNVPIRARWALLALGAVPRIVQFAHGRGFWLDEASLLGNLRERGPLGLLSGLGQAQLAPVGFLWAERAMYLAFGPSVFGMRVVPLVGGLAALALFDRLARRRLGPASANLAVGLFALSPDLIYYSSELKPYSTDVAVALALTLMAFRMRDDALPWRRAFAYAGFGALAAWFSFPAAFVLAGVGLALFARAVAEGDARRVGRLVAIGSTWAASLALVVLVGHEQLGHSTIMWSFWSAAFPEWPPRSFWDVSWPLRRFLFLFVNPLDFTWPLGPRASMVLPVALFGMGCARLARRDRVGLAVLVAPVALALVAGALRLYPFHGRLVLFLVPNLLLLICEGAAGLREGRWGVWAWRVVAVALLVGPSLHSLYNLPYPGIARELHPYGDLRPPELDPGRFPW